VVVDTPESRYLATFQVILCGWLWVGKRKEGPEMCMGTGLLQLLSWGKFTIPLMEDNQTPKFFLPREWQILQSLRGHCDTQPSFQSTKSVKW